MLWSHFLLKKWCKREGNILKTLVFKWINAWIVLILANHIMKIILEISKKGYWHASLWNWKQLNFNYFQSDFCSYQSTKLQKMWWWYNVNNTHKFFKKRKKLYYFSISKVARFNENQIIYNYTINSPHFS